MISLFGRRDAPSNFGEQGLPGPPERLIWRLSGFDPGGDLIAFEFVGPQAASESVMFRPVYVIGRDYQVCDFSINHPTVSRRHAELRYEAGEGFKLADVGSSNGTFIDNGEIKPWAFRLLQMSQTLRFGDIELMVSIRT